MCRRSLPSLRHGTPNEIKRVGGRYPRSDLLKSSNDGPSIRIGTGGSDLRHGTPNEIKRVGGRYPRSDLLKSSNDGPSIRIGTGGSDLRHGTPNEIKRVGGRYPRSDLLKSKNSSISIVNTCEINVYSILYSNLSVKKTFCQIVKKESVINYR